MDTIEPDWPKAIGPMLLWGLGSFIYFKVALDAGFNRDVTVLAAVLLGIITSIGVYFSGFFYAAKLGKHLARIRLREESGFFRSGILVWIVGVLISVILAKFLIFGFSDSRKG